MALFAWLLLGMLLLLAFLSVQQFTVPALSAEHVGMSIAVLLFLETTVVSVLARILFAVYAFTKVREVTHSWSPTLFKEVLEKRSEKRRAKTQRMSQLESNAVYELNTVSSPPSAATNTPNTV